jgi:pilus assembly protein CpaD
MRREAMADTNLKRAMSGNFAALAARVAVAIAAATTLAGCYQPREQLASAPLDYRDRHPISIVEGDRTMTVFVGSQRGGLMPAQRAEVLQFSQSWRREATGAVILDVPVHAPNEKAAMEAVREIQSLLRASDIPPAAIRIRQYQPADPARLASIKINYTRIAAATDECGRWPKDLAADTDPDWENNRPYFNLGCASQHNLAAMVDNPADLVQPRSETGAYAPRRSQALDKYRKGESTATVYPNPNQGKISDIGQ